MLPVPARQSTRKGAMADKCAVVMMTASSAAPHLQSPPQPSTAQASTAMAATIATIVCTVCACERAAGGRRACFSRTRWVRCTRRLVFPRKFYVIASERKASGRARVAGRVRIGGKKSQGIR